MAKKKNIKKKKQKALPKKSFNLKNYFKEFWASRSPAIQFFSIFLLGMILFYAVYFSPFFAKNIHPSIVGTQAKIGSFLIGLFSAGTSATGSVISGNSFSLDISGGCDGLEVTAILISGILAFPAIMKHKLKGILVGGAILTILNLLRFPVLYFTGANGYMELFDFLHIQGGFIIFVGITLVMWVIWANWAKKAEAHYIEAAS